MPKGKAKAAKKAVAQSAPIVEEITPAGSAPKSADSNPEDDLTSSTSKVAIECNAVIKSFVQGARPKAKKALQRLANEYPRSPLPHRYLARLLYHEAATLDPAESSQNNRQRLDLLREALDSGQTASDLCPASLSCAALRATMVTNSLVCASLGNCPTLPSGQECEDMRQQFQGAYEACKKSLAAQPILDEPVICISTVNQKTCDPCCLRIQDQVQTMVKEGRWQEVTNEKREVMLHMQDVLRSCHTLLQTTQIPMNGVVNLLQHILKPHHEELKAWANQLLLSKTALLEALQQQVEKQQAMADLIKRIKPQDGCAMRSAGALSVPSMPQPSLGPRHDGPASAASLSMDRDFDYGKDPTALNRRKARKASERRNELTMQERFQDVKDFWLKQGPTRRRQLLKVPIRRLLQVIQREHGQQIAEELEHGLSLLREYSNMRACFWICPFCPSKEGAPRQFTSAKDFLTHVDACHEGVQLSEDGLPCICHGCNCQVVGDHYRSTAETGGVLCLRCHHLELVGGGQAKLQSYERVASQDPASLHCGWEDDSDFFSSRGSFGSLDEEYVRDSLAALGSRLPPDALPPFGTAEASQWFDDWNQSMEAQMRSRLPFGPDMQQGVPAEQVPHGSMALGHPVIAPVQLDAPLPAQSAAQPPLEHVPHLNGGVSLPPRTARPQQQQRRGSSDEGGSSAAAANGSGAAHAWGVNGPSGSGSEAQADGSSSWRSLFPKQLELWRSAYSDKAATAPVGVPPAPMHSYADRVKKSAAPKLTSEAGLHPTALTNGSAPHPPAPSADATQPMPWLPASGAPLGSPLHYAPSPPLMGAMLPVESAQSGQPGSYEGQLVSHIMQYINNLWRMDPSNFSATLNLICMRAPALMQRMMDHELAANAAVDERFAAQQQQPCAAGAIAAAPSMPAFLPAAYPLQHPHELEAALSQLPMGDLNTLLRYICQYMPMGPCPGVAPPTGPPLTDGTSSDGGDWDEEQVCPPLFGFASPSDADQLDNIADDVLGAQEDLRLARPQEEPELENEAAVAGQPSLVVQPWWMNHLLEARGADVDSGVGTTPEAAGDVRLLRWAYGAVVNTTAAAVTERRRELLSGKTADAALLGLYEDIARVWRRLNELGSKKSRLQQLRRGSERAIREVRELEDRGAGELRVQAAQYVEALLPPSEAAQGQPCAPSAVRQFCEAAVKQPSQEHQMQLLSDPSAVRYAQALLEREMAALGLQQAMWAEEARESAVQGSAAADRLAAAQAELADADAELNHVQLEGPANHRKRDPIDKATKEAEYREKVADLKARIDSCTARVNSEEEQVNTAKIREENAKRQHDNAAAQLRTCTDHRCTMDALLNPDGVPSDFLAGADNSEAASLAQQPWYRILYVAQAINLYAERPYLQPGLPEARDFAQATEHSKQLTNAFRSDIQKYWDELENARRKLQELACVDLAGEITERALELVRAHIEAAAAHDREEAAARLLRELELEDAGKKAAEEKKGKKNKAKKKAGKAPKGEAENEAVLQTDASAAAASMKQQGSQKDLDIEYEAALEQRRKEVEGERLQRDREQERLRTAVAIQQQADASEVATAEDEESSDGYVSAAADAPAAVPGPDSLMNEAEFDAATRAAIQASLRDLKTRGVAGAGADPAPEASPDWQGPAADAKKKRNRKQRYKENLEKEKEAAAPKMRIVSYFGDWTCECGRQNRLWDTCKCQKAGPCRDWVRGRCKYGDECRFSHPPFDLPSGPAPPSPIARPSSDAEQLNPLAQPLPPVPPPPSAIVAPGPRDGRAKAVAMTASASESSLAGLQQSAPAAAPVPAASPAAQQPMSTWEQQQQQQAAAAPFQPPPPPPPRRASLDAAHLKAQPAPEQPPPQVQQDQQAQQQAPNKRELPTVAQWASAKPQQEPAQQQQPLSEKAAPEVPGFWAQAAVGPAQAGLARASSTSAAATAAIISKADPVVSWNPSGAAPMPEDRSPPAAAPAPAERPTEGPPTQDQIVAPPKRTASLSRLPLAAGGPADAAAVPGWAQMGGWGGRTGGGLGGVAAAAPATSAGPIAADAFDPFGDNPLHRALAADYRRDPVVAQPARKAPAAGPMLRSKALGEASAPGATAPRPALPQPVATVHRAESASDILGSMFYAQQQGAGLGLPGPLPGASKPFPPPFQHQQQQQQQQQQQRQQNQLAQWSMLQGAMRGASQVSVNPTNSANSANSANSVASLASWLPSPQQQPRPSRPHQGVNGGWDGSSALSNGYHSKVPSLSRTSSSPVILGQRLEEQLGQRRPPTPKLGPMYMGLDRVQAVNTDLLSFLSSACIALWHLPQFRTSLIAVQDSQLPASPNLRVLSALRAAFVALTASAGTPSSRSPSPFGAPALNGLSNSTSMLAQQGTNAAPLEVREALARAVEDAVGGAALQPADLLQVLLACLDRALPTPPGQASIFQQLLGLQAHQVVQCGGCGRAQDNAAVRMVQVLPAATVRAAGNLQHSQQPSLEAMLSAHLSEALSLAVCPPAKGGCGWKGKALTRLSGSPTACVVALAWSGPALQVDVVAVCSAIPLKLDLKQAFPGVGTEGMRLRCMLCGNLGGHMTFAREAASDSWRLFAAGAAMPVGEWPAVLARCRVHSLQPLALFFDSAW